MVAIKPNVMDHLIRLPFGAMIIIKVLIIITIIIIPKAFQTCHDGKNKIKAANTWAVSLIRYRAGTIK